MEYLFTASAAFVLYVLFVYPLLLALRASIWPKPVIRRFEPRSVSVILPVHNGTPWIARKLDSLLSLDYPRDRVEILVVSDGSTDATEAIVERYPAVRLIAIAKAGKAAALNAGLAHSTGEIAFLTDVRQPLEPASLRHLVACFADPEVGAATGELIILDGESHEEANVGLYWKYEKWIRRRLSGLDSVLGATGCIYAMRRRLIRPLPAGTLLDDVEMPMQAFFAGRRIVMEERAKAYDEPTRLDHEFRRKVRTQAGMIQFIRSHPQVLIPGNRMWLDVVSYKLGRLLLPWALLLMAISSFGLSEPARSVALGAQTLFYAAALIDWWIPERTPLKSLTAPIRAFVVLVAAAFCATSIFFVPPERLWRKAPAKP